VTALARDGGTWRIATPAGEVRAAGIVLAGDGYLHGLAPEVESRVMPINNFIAVTEPLGAERARSLIPRDVAVADSRFVVNYYRTTADHRLLFGGGETYSFAFPADVGEFVRPHFARVFPSLADVRIDYAWGGAVSVTPHRLPYVRELAPGLVNASGYSGLGVVLAPYTGKILAEALLGERREFELLAGLPVPRFPGGRWLRRPTLVAAMTWYALRDRL
jgi:gamma-glutamylputrescine oxidase